MAFARTMAQKPLREGCHLPREGWSDWMRAMVPANIQNTNGIENRGPFQVGFMWSFIANQLNEVGSLCGIYEWRAKGTFPHQPNLVVYVGSTCTREGTCHRLKNRIIRYCKYGNHKEHLINDALRRGYELWVRFKQAVGEEDAKQMENELLNKYDYAWNIRINGFVRNILP